MNSIHQIALQQSHDVVPDHLPFVGAGNCGSSNCPDTKGVLIMFRILLLSVASLYIPIALAQDAVQTDGDKYKVILENDCVRVLDYRDNPGDKTHQHKHPPFVLYALSSFKRSLTLPNGKVLKREFKEGDVMWSEEQTHVGENIGQTPTHVIIVELKEFNLSCSK